MRILIMMCLVLVFSCGTKSKTDQEKFVGKWQINTITGYSNNKVLIDTVYFTDNQYYPVNNNAYTYFLRNNILHYYKPSEKDTNRLIYNFIDDNTIKLNTVLVTGDVYFKLIRI